MQGPRTGVLLLNLGTPDGPDVPAVRRYLREFLSDPRVIDLPAPARWALVNLVIAPFRSPKSAAAYRTIWTAAGSPLLVHGRALAAGLTEALGVPVALAMRYGNPSVGSALAALGPLDELVVVPLYPQYASATTGSSLEHLYTSLGARPAIPAVRVVRPLVQYPSLLDAMAEVARPRLEAFAPDAVLFSYHGLPERQLRALSDSVGGPACAADDTCCARPDAAFGHCYRAQCLATSAGLASRLGLPGALAPERVRSSFQSRLGRARWIQPYTEDVLTELARGGARRLAVLTPAFAADCLETLEEIGERGAATFRAAGGEALLQVECPNAHPRWVEALAGVVGGEAGVTYPSHANG